MPRTTSHSTPGARRRLVALWSFLTVASVGFAFLVAGFTLDSTWWVSLGAGVLAFGALTFLFVQFWGLSTTTLTGPRPVATAVTPLASLNYSYPQTPKPIVTATPATNPAILASLPEEEPLVEFQLVSGPTAPTRLVVPPAFQIEETVSAAPPEPAGWSSRTWASARLQKEDFAPAMERRAQIVSGLPLISSILAEEPPEAVQVKPETRPGRMRGQCGSCHTFLWAPTQRPIRLRCPRCGHVRTLTD